MRLFLTLMLLFSLKPSLAADYESAQRLKAGDVISADVMNDILDRIELTLRSATSADLVGSWDVTQTTCPLCTLGDCNINAASAVAPSGYGDPVDGLFRQRADVVVFSDDGDGTFSFQTEDYCALTRGGVGNSSCSGGYAVVDGRMIIGAVDSFSAYVITRVSETRFILSLNANGSSSYNIIRLDKRGLAPNAPTNLAYSRTSDGPYSLSWTAASGTVSSYSIKYKNEVEDDFSELTTTTSNSYTVTAGYGEERWYRVFAVNDNGTSIGSNVILVDDDDSSSD